MFYKDKKKKKRHFHIIKTRHLKKVAVVCSDKTKLFSFRFNTKTVLLKYYIKSDMYIVFVSDPSKHEKLYVFSFLECTSKYI